MNLLLLGPPGVGKGTQAALLQAQTGLKHIASGELLRRHMLSETHLDIRARDYVNSGELVPDAIVSGMILDRIVQPDCTAGVIFDGFPRTREQARALASALDRHQRTLDGVIFLSAPRDVLLQRITGRQACPACAQAYNRYFAPPRHAGICDHCGGGLVTRADDNEATARRRLDVYVQQTMPLVEHFRLQGRLHEVDGTGEAPHVTRRILHAVTARSADARRPIPTPRRVATGACGANGSPASSTRP